MAHIREVMAAGVPSPLARMLGNNQLNTVIAGGASQEDATPLVINFALIRTPSLGQGVRLGPASGAAITALYNVGPAAVNLYPAEDETLNDQEADLPVSLAAGQTMLGVPSINCWLVQIPPGGPSGGVPDAPSDGTAYGRWNASWAPVIETAGGTMTGPLVLAGNPTVALGAATKGYVDGATALLAPLASPAFTGAPTAPSPPANDNSTRLATTAFVNQQNYLTALTFAGDLAGSGGSPLNATVVGLQGRAMSAAAPTNGEVLVWSGAGNAWTPTAAPPASAGGSAGQMQWNSAGVLAGVTISGDATINTATGALTLAAVNANVGTFQGLTLDGKGRVTAAANMNYAPLASPVFTGTPAAPTPATADNSTALATTAYVKAQGYQTAAQILAVYAPLASPALTGNPTAPTPVTTDNDTSIATTAYVQAQGYQTAAQISAVYAPLASPALTGTPTAPTAPTATNTTQIASTAYVKAQGYQTANQTITLSGDTTGSGATAITTVTGKVNGNTYPASLISGGVLYASGAAAVASSAVLAAGALVLGGGAGAAPAGAANWSLQAANVLLGNFNAVAAPASPLPGLHVAGLDAQIAGVLADTFGSSPNFLGRRAAGTNASPAALAVNQIMALFGGRGYTGSAYSLAATGYLAIEASEAWSGSANGTQLLFVVTPATTTSQVTAMQLGSGATSAAGGLVVGASGSDMGLGTVNAASGYFVAGTSLIATLFPSLTANALVIGNGANAAPVAAAQWSLQMANVLMGNSNAAAAPSTPLPGLHLNGADSQIVGILSDAYTSSVLYVGRAAGGTGASPAPTPINTILVQLGGRGWTGVGLYRQQHGLCSGPGDGGVER